MACAVRRSSGPGDGADFGTHNEGRATLKLYDVRNHSGTRYFSKLRVSGAKTGNGVWNWCFNFGEWQASCQD